jgi:hypothetical protein
MEFESEFESDMAEDLADYGEAENDPFLGDIAGAIGGLLGFEDEDPFESELFESDVFENGTMFESTDAAELMEMLADQVAEAESEAEADEFLPILGALAPLAMKALPAVAKLAPRVLSIGRRAVPHLARGAMRIGRQLARTPAGRRAIRTLPTVVRKTAADIARGAARGRPVTARTVTRTLANNTAQVLRNPQRRPAAVRRCRRIAQRGRGGIGSLRQGRCCCC